MCCAPQSENVCKKVAKMCTIFTDFGFSTPGEKFILMHWITGFLTYCHFFYQGFNHHVKQEHNMWAYIFFFIHLDDTKPNDYTSLDLYVSSLVCDS